MENEYITMGLRLFLAILAGGAVGIERTYHGRPAGFRTHTLVCVASALLMQFTVYQWQFMDLSPEAMSTLRVDPTRMAQGIMTGIGFLGAGVIVKEGITVRGLTTAASIWITASIGIVVGMGLYFAGFLATVIACGVLSIFRWLENKTPSLRYASLMVRFKRAEHLSDEALKKMVNDHQIEWTNPSYHLEKGSEFRYQMTVRTLNTDNFERLAQTLTSLDKVIGFSIQPTGD